MPYRVITRPAKPTPTLVNYTVVKALGNGGAIAGARRKQGDTFDADPRLVHFVELEGVIKPTASLTPHS